MAEYVMRRPVCLCRYDDDEVIVDTSQSSIEPILLPAPFTVHVPDDQPAPPTARESRGVEA